MKICTTGRDKDRTNDFSHTWTDLGKTRHKYPYSTSQASLKLENIQFYTIQYFYDSSLDKSILCRRIVYAICCTDLYVYQVVNTAFLFIYKPLIQSRLRQSRRMLVNKQQQT